MAKNKKNNFKSMKTWKKVLIIGLAVITLVGAIAGISALFREDDKTTKTINPAFSVGGLTENGAYLDTQESIYTKNAFECQGLDIEIAFDNNISYRVFFYDVGNNFLSSTETLTSNYNEDITPFEATTARIVITPNDDNKISWYEINGYADQLKISVNKEQVEIDYPYVGKNKFVYRTGVGMSGLSSGTSAFRLTESGNYNACELISTLGCDNISLKITDKEILSSVTLCLMNETSCTTKVINRLDYEETYFNGETYIMFNVPENCTALTMYSNTDVDFSGFELYVW